MQLSDSLYCHSTGDNRPTWSHLSQVRLSPFNRFVVVGRQITLLIYADVTKLHFNRLFVFVFKCLRSLQHPARVCRKDCLHIVDICTFMKGGNFEVDTFTSDVFMSKLGSMLSVTCRHCSVHTYRMESLSNGCLFDERLFDSNLLLFTLFLTV